MKIKKVTLTNFRNVPDGAYDLAGKSIFLLADNAKGKTNFQNAIRVALCKQLPGPGAIAAEQDEAAIEVIAGNFDTVWNDNPDGSREMRDLVPIDGTEYAFRCRIRRDKKGSEVAEFEVTMPNGLRDHRKTTIGGIVGELELKEDFVELSTTEAGRNKQIEILKTFMSEELRTILRIQEQRIGDLEIERTETGRERDRIQALVNSNPLRNTDLTKLAQPVDTKQALEELETVKGKNRDRENAQLQLDHMSKRLVEIEEAMAKLETEKKTIVERKANGEKWMTEHPLVDTTELQTRIENATKINQDWTAAEAFKADSAKLATLVEEYGTKTAHIETARECIRDAVREWTLPVPGLEYDVMTSKLSYNGILLHPDTMSNAERKVFTAQLLMAQMSNAEILFVGEGESIGLELLRSMQIEAQKRGIQIIMEEVERGTETLRIDYMVMPPLPAETDMPS